MSDIKTYKEDFLEKFPNAPLERQEDIPVACRETIYGRCYCPQGGCIKCWNEPMEEETK